MLRVGLTGGIGAGKSTVSRRLAGHGAVVVDADLLAREVVEPGSAGLAAVVEAFGADVLAPDGALDRPALGAIVFADDAARARLNGILHPLIGALTTERFAAAPADAVVVHDVPLLVEGGLAPNYHLVLVVHAPAEERLRRLVGERGMPEADARARIETQADDAARRAAADVWLDNSGAPDDVLAAVDRLWADRLVPFERNLRTGTAPAAPDVEVPADPTWSDQAARAAARVRRAGADLVLDVRHVGPTAVPGSAARDVLDLLVVVRGSAEAAAARLPDAGLVRVGAAGMPGAVPQLVGADPGRAVAVEVVSGDDSLYA